jgi:hypothetical protein
MGRTQGRREPAVAAAARPTRESPRASRAARGCLEGRRQAAERRRRTTILVATIGAAVLLIAAVVLFIETR